jgi:hypothetical protein
MASLLGALERPDGIASLTRVPLAPVLLAKFAKRKSPGQRLTIVTLATVVTP